MNHIFSNIIIESNKYGTIICNSDLTIEPIELFIEVYEKYDSVCFSNIKLCNVKIGEKSQLIYNDGLENPNHRISTHLLKNLLVKWDCIDKNNPLSLEFYNNTISIVEVNVIIRVNKRNLL